MTRPTTNKYGFTKSTATGPDLLWHGPVMDANLDLIDSALHSLSVMPINTQTDDYTLALNDAGALVRLDKATAINVTIPKNADVPFPIGTRIWIREVGIGLTTLVADSGVTLNNPGDDLHIANQYQTAEIIKVADDEWDIIGGTTGSGETI